MATYTFTLRSGGGTLADAKVTYQGAAYDIDDALAAGSGTITTTDDGLASVLRQQIRSDGLLLLVEGASSPGGVGLDRKVNVPLFVQADEPLARPYLWEKTSGGTPTGVRQYHDGASSYLVGSGSGSALAAGSIDSVDANGNPTSVTEGGVTTIYTWNADGTVHTEARSGQTKTYVYANSGSAIPTSWTVA